MPAPGRPTRSRGCEFDAYIGYGRTIMVHILPPVHLDAGVVGHLFAGDEHDAEGRHDFDFIEAYAGFRPGTASLKACLSPNCANTDGDAAAFRGTVRRRC